MIRRLLSVFCLGASLAAAADKPLVAMTQIVSHPSLNLIQQGIVDALAEAGYKDGSSMTLDYQIAQGDQTIATQIAKQFAGAKPAVIVAITTPSAQAVAAAVRETPVIFATVTDPLAAKLVSHLDKPGGNISGTSDAIPLDDNLDFVHALLPEARRIGHLYNPGDANSVSTLQKLKAAAAVRGWEVVERAVNKSADTLEAAQSLVGKADLIWVGVDNTVVSSIEAVVQVAEKNRLPLLVSDVESVSRGAMAALGYDSYLAGKQTGAMVVKVMKGASPGDLPVEFARDFERVINREAARKMGVEIDPQVLSGARVIENSLGQ